VRIGWNGAGEPVSLDGKEIAARGRLSIEDEPCPVLLAALGEKMLDLAGRGADGVTLWMVGPRTVAGPEGLLALGSEDAVREQLAAFERAGATDIRVNTLCPTPEETERTYTFLRTLCREKNRT
jgi:alkanesulfonate monooxygenase SsuD/methylene tetrahydromethanopterin reductase-like flavin-dependent oxidoreductase (luciferase family)